MWCSITLKHPNGMVPAPVRSLLPYNIQCSVLVLLENLPQLCVQRSHIEICQLGNVDTTLAQLVCVCNFVHGERCRRLDRLLNGLFRHFVGRLSSISITDVPQQSVERTSAVGRLGDRLDSSHVLALPSSPPTGDATEVV
jgi:hypothetical protein